MLVTLRLASALIALACVIAPAPAQNVYDIPAPAGVCVGQEGFFQPGAFAHAWSYCGIQRWVGLPGSPNHLTLTPTGSLALDFLWDPVNESTAVYSAVGPDLAPGTGDETLVLVTDLPWYPTLVPTGLSAPSTPGRHWQPVNDGTAVLLDVNALTFHVLRFDPTGASLQSLPCPSLGSPGQGRLSDDAYIVLGAGPDLTPETTDDVVILFEGLAGPTTTMTSHALPAGTAPKRLVVTETGIGCCMQPQGLDDMLLTFVRLQPNGFAFDTLIVDPPMYGLFPTFSLEGGIGDSVIAKVMFDVPPDPHVGICLVSCASSTPTVLASWAANDFESHSQQIEEDEVVHWDLLADTLVYTRYFTGGSTSLNAVAAPDFWDIVRPKPDTLVIMGRDPNLDTEFITVRGLWGTNDFSTLTIPGRPDSEPVAIGPGMIAFWVTHPPYYAQVDTLRVITLPGVSEVGPGVAPGFPQPVDMTITPAPPVPGTPLTFQVTHPPAWSATTVLGLSTTTQETGLPMGPPFAAGSVLQLGFEGLAPQLLPLGGSGGTAQLLIDPWASTTLVDLISGHTFYFQSVVYDGSGSYHLSPALMLVLH